MPYTMKKTTKFVIGLAVLVIILTLGPWKVLKGVEVIEIEKVDQLSYQQRAWLGALMWCESKGNPDAVNPKDLDNTPSWGILQFKPGTFYNFGLLYGIDTSKGYMDPDTQIKIVEQMILKGNVKWSQQFPACVRKLGNPPKTVISIDK